MAPGKSKVPKKVPGVFGKAAGELFDIPGHKGKAKGLRADDLPQKKVTDWGKTRKGGGDDMVDSRKVDYKDPNIDPRDKEMADAIAQARLNEGHNKPSINYNAVRYIDGNGDERILVSHSRGMHSERVVINYLLDDGVPPENIREVMTERSPCIKSPNCSKWLAVNVPGIKSSHLVDYQMGDNANSNYNATKGVRSWTNDIFSGNLPW